MHWASNVYVCICAYVYIYPRKQLNNPAVSSGDEKWQVFISLGEMYSPKTMNVVDKRNERKKVFTKPKKVTCHRSRYFDERKTLHGLEPVEGVTDLRMGHMIYLTLPWS